jgi:hypothetical protein
LGTLEKFFPQIFVCISTGYRLDFENFSKDPIKKFNYSTNVGVLWEQRIESVIPLAISAQALSRAVDKHESRSVPTALEQFCLPLNDMHTRQLNVDSLITFNVIQTVGAISAIAMIKIFLIFFVFIRFPLRFHKQCNDTIQFRSFHPFQNKNYFPYISNNLLEEQYFRKFPAYNIFHLNNIDHALNEPTGN